jgi:hypothetical protein
VEKAAATVEKKGYWLKISSNTSRCSRVDWYANERPFISIVTDGVITEEWLGPTQNPKLTIDMCKICKDKMYSTSKDNDITISETKNSIAHYSDNRRQEQRNVVIDQSAESYVFSGYCNGCTNTEETIPVGRILSAQLRDLVAAGKEVKIYLEEFRPIWVDGSFFSNNGSLKNVISLRLEIDGRPMAVRNSQRGYSFDKTSGREAYLSSRLSSVESDISEIRGEISRLIR